MLGNWQKGTFYGDRPTIILKDGEKKNIRTVGRHILFKKGKDERGGENFLELLVSSCLTGATPGGTSSDHPKEAHPPGWGLDEKNFSHSRRKGKQAAL